MSKPLTESVLCRLTSQSLVTYLGQAETFESVMHPGVATGLTRAAVADLTYVVAGRGADDAGQFEAACTACISRDLPFLAIIFPEAGSGVERTAAELGLVHVVDFPFMVRDDSPVEPRGNDSVVVRRAVGPEGADANARVLSSAFGLPEESARAFPVSLLDSPNLDVFLAVIGNDVVGTVTVIHLGDTSGIWSIATDTTRQRSGVGRRLLTTAIASVIEGRGGEFGRWATAEPESGMVDAAGRPQITAVPRVGRNFPGPCGSGKKYKRCHGAR